MILAHNRNAALYCRLSRDDRNVSESDSIQNQEMILTKYAKENGFHVVDVYKDDGYTGTNFDRPDFIRMLKDLRTKRADTVIVKDLSRFGREHIQADLYREIEFPQMGVRLIAIHDQYDGADVNRSTNSMAQMKGLFNEWMAAETSEKVRDVFRSKMEAGQYIAKVPFGYQKDSNDRHKIIPDEETVPVVLRIFDMAIEGKGYELIAKTLANERIPTPSAFTGKKKTSPYLSHDWHYSSVKTILKNPVYLGHTVQGKYTSISYKVKKVIRKPEDQWIVVENTHEPIILQSTWDMAQTIINKRKRSTKKGSPHIFAGLLRCSDCGSTLAKNSKDIFSCYRYKTQGKETCTNHHISLERLTEIVLESIQSILVQAMKDKTRFIERLSDIDQKKQRSRVKSMIRDRDKMMKRLDEIPTLIKVAFEQSANGLLDDRIYKEVLDSYQKEREILIEEVQELGAFIDEIEKSTAGTNGFMSLLDRYIDIKELDSVIVHELIEKIVVHQTQKVDGQRTQQIDIYYRFVGQIN